MGSLNLANRLNSIPTPTPSQSLDALFGTPTCEKKIDMLRLCDLEFAEQHTPMNSEDELTAMADTIVKRGVDEPILVRKMIADAKHPYDYYQVLNGRNRTAASRIAGKEDIPAIILEADDVEAQYIIAMTTIHQRQELSPSAKAWAYRSMYDAEKLMSGTRTDLVHNVHRVDTLANIARESDTSKRTAAYYIRLTFLTPELLNMVDTKRNPLPIRAGVALSYLSEHEQDTVHAYITEFHKVMSVEQAEQLRKYHDEMQTEVTHAVLDTLYGGKALSTPKTKSFRFAKKELQTIEALIPLTVQDTKGASVDYVLRALRYYEQHGDS